MQKSITPLSLTQVPFDGWCYLPVLNALCKKYPERIERTPRRAIIHTFGGQHYYHFSLKGLTLDECPLRWLDWLSQQKWLYGSFKQRLLKYMSRPCIQRELDEIFPDPEEQAFEFDVTPRPRPMQAMVRIALDGNKQFAPSFFIGQPDDQWHAQPMPKADSEPWNWSPPPRRKLWVEAWQYAAEALLIFESGSAAHADLLSIKRLRQAIKLLPMATAQRLRMAFKKWAKSAK